MNISESSIIIFLEKVKGANRSRSKEIRLTLEEAQDLVATIAQIQSYHISLFERISALENKIQNIPVTLSVSGGKF